MKPWIVLIFIFVLGACQDVKRPEKPKNLIGKDKMATILTESYLINAARNVDNKTILEAGIALDSLFYDKFGIDSLQFVQSNAYYAADVDAYMSLLQVVEARLEAMQRELDSLRSKAMPINDSIKGQASQ